MVSREDRNTEEWQMPTGWYMPGGPGIEGIPEPGPCEVALDINPDTFTLELLEKAWKENVTDRREG